MKLGLEKCAVFHLSMGRAKGVGKDAKLVDRSNMRHLGAGESYNFLDIPRRGLQEANAIKETLLSRRK